MDSLSVSRIGCFTGITSRRWSYAPNIVRRRFVFTRRILSISASSTISPAQMAETEEEDVLVLQMFFKERELSGDIVTKAADQLWHRQQISKLVDVSSSTDPSLPQSEQETGSVEEYDDNGFLKLKTTKDWLLGEKSVPFNKKARAKAMRDDSERRKKLNFLKYEAIKRELLLLTVSVGTACTGYCLVTLSVQAAISYAVGVLFSCLYLQLLFRYADNLSSNSVPEIFMKKKTKKIGIRSEDLEDSLTRTFRGSSMALSSPRLVIPAAIYSLWILSHQQFTGSIFDFQIVPAMFGLFAYKAAALVQVYRDNEDLHCNSACQFKSAPPTLAGRVFL